MYTVDKELPRQVAFSALSHPDVAAAMAYAREERSKMLGRLVIEGGSWMVHLFKEWLVGPIGRALVRRNVYRQLMSLDDRMLSDIGISRGQIPWVAEHACLTQATKPEKAPATAEIHTFPGRETPVVTDTHTVPPLAA